jgi:predicted deacylase
MSDRIEAAIARAVQRRRCRCKVAVTADDIAADLRIAPLTAADRLAVFAAMRGFVLQRRVYALVEDRDALRIIRPDEANGSRAPACRLPR